MLWSLPVALACGGTFCDATAPTTVRVEQTGERVLFGVDGDTIEAHVQVSYSGTASEFAWIVPVPSVPELFTSSQAVFDNLEPETVARWNYEDVVAGTCRQSLTIGGGTSNDDAPPSCADGVCDADPADLGSVQVVGSSAVGPYETVILQATVAEDLVEWLAERSFSVTDEMVPRIQPYLDTGSYFVALRLSNGASTRDIVPLGFRYESSEPMIPMQLTGVAASEDMRLHVWVFGEHRAVPTSYLHVKINPFAIGWVNGGANYEELIRDAADEAGGQAFATDGAILTADLPTPSPLPAVSSVARMPTSQPEFLAALVALGVPIDPDTAPILGRYLPVPDTAMEAGFDDLGWWTCLSQPFCAQTWSQGLPPVDTASVAAELEVWSEAVARGRDLVQRHRVVTRLRSSMGPHEMTVDPVFSLNPDMPLVDPVRTATLTRHCGASTYAQSGAPRSFTVPDGRVAYLGTFDNGVRLNEMMDMLGDVAAEVIEETHASGPPLLIRSHMEAHAEVLGELERAHGCGCQQRGGGGGWTVLPLLGLLLRRRTGQSKVYTT